MLKLLHENRLGKTIEWESGYLCLAVVGLFFRPGVVSFENLSLRHFAKFEAIMLINNRSVATFVCQYGRIADTVTEHRLNV
jgi:hypothetical protein